MIFDLMKHIGWRERLFKSTRGKILELLRTRECTVNDLAAKLRLTDNAVRAHLANLERDRLVVQSGMKPGIRKPHTTYVLGPEAEQLFPKAYGRLLSLLMSIFSRQVKPRNLRAGMRAAGRQVAGVCATCAAKRDSKELMLHSAFSKSWAAQRALRKKMESTSSTATAVQSPPQQQIIPKHVCSRSRC
jgi:predicted ArsR family transcriptional regulator